MSHMLVEPGFWAVVFLFAVVVNEAIGAIVSRSAFKELNDIAEAQLDALDLEQDPAVVTARRAEIARELTYSSAWFTRLAAYICAPIVAIVMLIKAVAIARAADPKLALEAYLQPRRNVSRELAQAAGAAFFRSSPLLFVFTVLCLFIPVLALAVASGQAPRFFTNIRHWMWAGRRHLTDDISMHRMA